MIINEAGFTGTIDCLLDRHRRRRGDGHQREPHPVLLDVHRAVEAGEGLHQQRGHADHPELQVRRVGRRPVARAGSRWEHENPFPLGRPESVPGGGMERERLGSQADVHQPALGPGRYFGAPRPWDQQYPGYLRQRLVLPLRRSRQRNPDHRQERRADQAFRAGRVGQRPQRDVCHYPEYPPAPDGQVPGRDNRPLLLRRAVVRSGDREVHQRQSVNAQRGRICFLRQ